jgi:hypothetical protein
MQIDLRRLVRGRSAEIRELYSGLRRAGAFFRDRERRRLRRAADPLFVVPEDRGFAVLPPGRLPGVDAVIADACELLRRIDGQPLPQVKNKKRFLVNILDPAALTLDSPAMQLALEPGILGAVSRYLGVVPLLTAVSVFFSDALDRVPEGSQLFHCDGDEIRQLKLFVYCSDVDASSGPLTLLDATTSRAVQRRTGYQYRSRLTDAQVHEAMPSAAVVPIVGAAGTVAAVDTSRCFHYGSRVQPGAPPRLVTMLQYSTPYSFMLPRRYQTAAPFRRLVAANDPPLIRLVLGE